MMYFQQLISEKNILKGGEKKSGDDWKDLTDCALMLMSADLDKLVSWSQQTLGCRVYSISAKDESTYDKKDGRQGIISKTYPICARRYYPRPTFIADRRTNELTNTFRCGVSIEFVLEHSVSIAQSASIPENNGIWFKLAVSGNREIKRFAEWYSYHKRLFEIIVKRFRLGFEYVATDNRLENLESKNTLRLLNHFLDSPREGDAFTFTSYYAILQPAESLPARFLAFTALYDSIYYAADKENYDRILNHYCPLKEHLGW